MNDKVDDLEYLTLSVLLVRLAKRCAETEEKLKLADVVRTAMAGREFKGEKEQEAKDALERILKATQPLEEHLLELKSVLHWLTQVRR